MRLVGLAGVGTVTTKTKSARAHGPGRWQTRRGAGKGGRVDGRHPDPSLIDLEQIRDERVEVDIRIREVVEGQLLPVTVAGSRMVSVNNHDGEHKNKGRWSERGEPGEYAHLKLRVENLHVQTVFNDLLQTDPLRLGFIAFFVAQTLDLVMLRETLDHLGLDLGRARLMHATLSALRPHAADRAGAVVGEQSAMAHAGATALGLVGVTREEHQPFVVLLRELLLELLRLCPCDVSMCDGAEIGATIGFDDDHVALLDLKTGSLLDVEEFAPAALEGDHAEQLIGTRLGETQMRITTGHGRLGTAGTVGVVVRQVGLVQGKGLVGDGVEGRDPLRLLGGGEVGGCILSGL